MSLLYSLISAPDMQITVDLNEMCIVYIVNYIRMDCYTFSSGRLIV